MSLNERSENRSFCLSNILQRSNSTNRLRHILRDNQRGAENIPHSLVNLVIDIFSFELQVGYFLSSSDVQNIVNLSKHPEYFKSLIDCNYNMKDVIAVKQLSKFAELVFSLEKDDSSLKQTSTEISPNWFGLYLLNQIGANIVTHCSDFEKYQENNQVRMRSHFLFHAYKSLKLAVKSEKPNSARGSSFKHSKELMIQYCCVEFDNLNKAVQLIEPLVNSISLNDLKEPNRDLYFYIDALSSLGKTAFQVSQELNLDEKVSSDLVDMKTKTNWLTKAIEKGMNSFQLADEYLDCLETNSSDTTFNEMHKLYFIKLTSLHYLSNALLASSKSVPCEETSQAYLIMALDYLGNLYAQTDFQKPAIDSEYGLLISCFETTRYILDKNIVKKPRDKHKCYLDAFKSSFRKFLLDNGVKEYYANKISYIKSPVSSLLQRRHD